MKFTTNNKQTLQVYEFIEDELKDEVIEALQDIQWQATVNGANKLKRLIYATLKSQVEKRSPILTDFLTDSLSRVDWEALAKYYLEEQK